MGASGIDIGIAPRSGVSRAAQRLNEADPRSGFGLNELLDARA